MRNKSTLLLDGRRGLLMNSRRRFSLRILELNRPFMMLSSMTSLVLKLLAGCSSNRFRSLNFFFIAALKWLEGECSSQTYSLQISSYCIHLALAHQALLLPCWWLFQWWDRSPCSVEKGWSLKFPPNSSLISSFKSQDFPSEDYLA